MEKHLWKKLRRITGLKKIYLTKLTDALGLQIEETGQKNTVLTLYELIHGDMTASQGLLLPSSSHHHTHFTITDGLTLAQNFTAWTQKFCNGL